MNNMDDGIANLNAFLAKANDTLLCGSACQQQKQNNLLKQQYENAMANVEMAPSMLSEAKKNYVVATQGIAAYNSMMSENYTAAANKIADTFQNNFNNEVAQIQIKINDSVTIFNNATNIKDLYFKYKYENNNFKKKYTTEHSDIETNDRKTYYENQEIEILNTIYKVLKAIYIIMVIVYFGLIFAYDSPYNWKIKFAILIFLIIIPFVSTKILSFIISIIYKLYDFLPKNVYKNL